MANNNESEVVDELHDVIETEGNETTDWKAEHKTLTEKAIRSRERTKSLREELKALKLENDGLKKSTPSPSPQNKKEDKSDEFGLVHKSVLYSLGITGDEEVELARSTAKKWGISYDNIDKLAKDEDFKIKLEKLRTERSNADAISNLKGGGGRTDAKTSPDYWVAKGVVPTPEQVPDRKMRTAIVRAFMKSAGKSDKKFYNE